jgi:hypothetical protein
MIVEERTDQPATGKPAGYLRLSGEEGRATQEPILGHMVGWFTAALVADLAWQAVTAKPAALIGKRESRILQPAPVVAHRRHRRMTFA